MGDFIDFFWCGVDRGNLWFFSSLIKRLSLLCLIVGHAKLRVGYVSEAGWINSFPLIILIDFRLKIVFYTENYSRFGTIYHKIALFFAIPPSPYFKVLKIRLTFDSSKISLNLYNGDSPRKKKKKRKN